MTSAALLGVDTCPMEGFDPAQYDASWAWKAAASTPWWRAPRATGPQDDAYAARPKVRFPQEELVAYI